MRPCISIRGSVHPFVGWSVCWSVRHAFVENKENHYFRASNCMTRYTRQIACNHIIIQPFKHHEDASLALWALFYNFFIFSLSSSLLLRLSFLLIPLSSSSLLPPPSSVFLLQHCLNRLKSLKDQSSSLDRQTDEPTDGRTNKPSYRLPQLKKCVLQFSSLRNRTLKYFTTHLNRLASPWKKW